MFQQIVRNCCPKFVGNEVKSVRKLNARTFFASYVSFYKPFNWTPHPTLEKLLCYDLEVGYKELIQKLQDSVTMFSIVQLPTGGGYTYYNR